MKKKARVIVDIAMVLLLPLLMAYSLVGEAVHEYLGIVMSLLFVVHHALNIAWWRRIFCGKHTALRILETAVNLALAVIMLALPISGMILSRHAFHFLHFEGTSVAATVHLLASYWGLVLMSFHAGMHGKRMMGALRKATETRRASKIGIWVLRILAVPLVICGLYAFVKNGIASYLFLQTRFVFIDFSQPAVKTLADYLSIIILFMILGYCLALFARCNRR